MDTFARRKEKRWKRERRCVCVYMRAQSIHPTTKHGHSCSSPTRSTAALILSSSFPSPSPSPHCIGRGKNDINDQSPLKELQENNSIDSHSPRPSLLQTKHTMPLGQRSRGYVSVSATNSEEIPDLRPLPPAHAPLVSRDPSNAVPFDMSILTISHKKGVNTLKALIVGGGISGLALAIMMDLANIEYEILEQYTGDEAGAGSALTLGPPVLRLLEQMGLLDQIEKVSIPVTGITVIDVECRRLGGFIGFGPERYGYPYRIMTRPAFYKILLDRVPKANLRRGKIVVDTLQNSNGVSCKCSDGSTYYGDIIVGADGAQSRTRERMYKQLAEQGKLPDADMEPSIYDHTSITGVSDVLDQTVYPLITDEKSDFQVIYNGTPRSFWYMPAPGNRIAWGLNGQLSTPKYGQSAFTDAHTAQRRDATLRRQLSHSSFSSQTPSLPQQNIYHDWLVPGPDFDDQFKDLLEARCAAGVGKVRDFLSHTPRESMSRVDLEERLYKTWYHSRIVLVGDACHPQLLVGGQGAIQGILDGVCLVNLLYDMEHNSPNEITKAFRKYHSKRSVIAKSSIDETNTIDKVFHDQGLVAGVMRRLIFNTAWNFNMGNDKFNSSRPQLSFLPFVEDRGSNKAKEQKISERLLRDSQP